MRGREISKFPQHGKTMRWLRCEEIFWASMVDSPSLFCSNAGGVQLAYKLLSKGTCQRNSFSGVFYSVEKNRNAYSIFRRFGGWPPRKRRKQHNGSRYISKLELLRNNSFLTYKRDVVAWRCRWRQNKIQLTGYLWGSIDGSNSVGPTGCGFLTFLSVECIIWFKLQVMTRSSIYLPTPT